MTSFRSTGALANPLRALMVAMAFVAAAAAVRAEPLTPTARNQAIVRQAFEKWQGGANIFAGLIAPDVRWTIHGSGPVAGTYTSLQDFTERASAPLISRLATPLVPVVHDIWAVRDFVIIRFDASATTTSGAPYANRFVWIFRMKGGVVTEAEAFLDLAAYQEVVDNNPQRSN